MSGEKEIGVCESSMESETIVVLNCGGQRFETALSTLRVDSESKMYSMFSVKNLDKFKKDDKNCFFVDLNPRHFAFILDYLRIVGSLKKRRGALQARRGRNEIRGTFQMYKWEYEVREIYLGDKSEPCSADELLDHVLPTTTEDVYGVLMQAEYFGLYHLKSLLAKRMCRGGSVGFLLEDMLEALGGKHHGEHHQEHHHPNGQAEEEDHAKMRGSLVDESGQNRRHHKN